MKKYLSYSIIGLGLILQSCGSDKPKAFRWSISPLQQGVLKGQDLNYNLNTFSSTFDSLVVINGKSKTVYNSGQSKISLKTDDFKLGTDDVKFEMYANNRKYTKFGKYAIFSDIKPKHYTYEVLETYAHNPKSFTQGLEFDGDKLYEGTGQRGKSKLMQIDLKTGNSVKEIKNTDDIFGEGITLMNNKIYQLSWESRKGFVYNQEDFTLERTFPFGKSVQGWGLCNDGKFLYKSDGTNRIYKIDPVTFKEISSVQVFSNKQEYGFLNEMEWIDGKIYANVYMKDIVLIINPETGAVDGIIDFSNLLFKPSKAGTREEVLNGIAYKGIKDELYITGKLWPSLFKVKLIEK